MFVGFFLYRLAWSVDVNVAVLVVPTVEADDSREQCNDHPYATLTATPRVTHTGVISLLSEGSRRWGWSPLTQDTNIINSSFVPRWDRSASAKWNSGAVDTSYSGWRMAGARGGCWWFQGGWIRWVGRGGGTTGQHTNPLTGRRLDHLSESHPQPFPPAVFLVYLFPFISAGSLWEFSSWPKPGCVSMQGAGSRARPAFLVGRWRFDR